MLRRIALLSVALFAIAPTAADAAPFRDRVLGGPAAPSKPKAKAAQAATAIAVPTAEGYSVSVSFTPEAGANPDLAASYVAYLDSLPHSTELSRLKVQIAAPTQVGPLCGGTEEDGILGCYGAADRQMIVPSSGLDTTTADGQYSVRYVITHEYGHHVAANRKNNEFAGGALDNGPKYWSSYELVCNRTIEGLLYPGDESSHYRANPGENWAEAYARLTFPEQPWVFSELLQPDAGGLEAVRKDVFTPWTRNTTATFTMASGRNRQAFNVPLTLDGRLGATITGPAGSKVALRVASGRQKVGASKGKGRKGTFSLASGCREKPVETITFTATRSGGRRGPVTLRVSYPG